MSAELQADLFTIDHRELLRRPLKHAIAIDPTNPVEIDDAVSVELLGDYIFKVEVHVADAGLLLGESALIHAARRKGWTQYPATGSRIAPDLMLPADIALNKLGLDCNHFDLGAPAITVGFTFDTALRRVQELDIYKSRVVCEVLTYEQFGTKLQWNDKKAHILTSIAKLINQDVDTPSEFNQDTQSHDTVGELMVAANRLIAEEMRKHDIPWLFRNHRQKISTNLRDFDITSFNETVFSLLDALGRGRYSSLAQRHEGLNLMPYTHFTSPLRRFPDLVNHLTLHALLTGTELPFTQDELDIVAEELALKTASEIGALTTLYADVS